MEEKKVADLLPLPAAVCVKTDESIEQLVRTVLEHLESHNVCVVDEDGGLQGVINIKSIFRTIFFHHTEPRTMITRQLIRLTTAEVVGDIMVTEPVIARETETLGDVIQKMITHNLGELPVVDERGQLRGSISIHMILKVWMQTKKEGEPIL